jgi:hypothetical protein
MIHTTRRVAGSPKIGLTMQPGDKQVARRFCVRGTRRFMSFSPLHFVCQSNCSQIAVSWFSAPHKGSETLACR